MSFRTAPIYYVHDLSELILTFSPQGASMTICFDSARLTITEYQMRDAEDLFSCISPAITAFMPWDPPHSVDDLKANRQAMADSTQANDFRFVIRLKITTECLGAASLDDAGSPTPEVGIWLRQTAHGFGYGSEVMKTVCEWATEAFDSKGFTYPVAVNNLPSRRIAERLGGVVTEYRTNPKYNSVIYRIPRQPLRADPA